MITVKECNDVIIIFFPLNKTASVSKPTIGKSQPDPGKREFILTCDGNTTGAEPVRFSWKADNNWLTEISEKYYIVTVFFNI